jgi:hypothetical protein
MQLLLGYIRSLQKSGLTAFGNNHTIARRHIIDLVVLAATPHQSVGETSLSGSQQRTFTPYLIISRRTFRTHGPGCMPHTC